MLSDTMMLGGGRKAAYSIENSLLFRAGQCLTRTPSAAGNTRKWTFSAWVRRAGLGAVQELFSAGTSAAAHAIQFDAGDRLAIQWNGSQSTLFTSATVFRDTTSFYHVVVAVDTNGPAGSRLLVYVNGNRISMSGEPNAAAVGWINSVSYAHNVGGRPATNYFDGYIAGPLLVDDAVMVPANFGAVDSVTGNWHPKAIAGISWGGNGFYLGKPWNASGLGVDYSGQGNNWTPVGFSTSGVVNDSPTNVHATLNTLHGANVTGPSSSQGNLCFTTSSSGLSAHPGAYVPPSGKWFWSVTVTSGTEISIGIIPVSWNGQSDINQASTLAYIYYTDNLGRQQKVYNGVAESYGRQLSVNDVIDVLLDLDARTIAFRHNGINCGVAFTGVSGNYYPLFGDGSKVYATSGIANFGQRAFAYAPPAGFKALCTANLPATTGQTGGSFTGNGSADGPFVFTGAVPVTLAVNGNAVTWGVHADKLATGFKIRTASTAYNSTGTNTWTATYDRKPTVGPKGRAPANAQTNP